jgi:hypothetical protein
MSLRDDLSRLLDKHSVTEICKEFSFLLSRQAEQAIEDGNLIYGERLQDISNKFWEMENAGL